MSIVSSLAHRLAVRRLARMRARAADPAPQQARVLARLVRAGRRTAFGREHGFDRVATHADFVRAVPLRDYAGMAPWWQRAKAGERDVAWPGAIRCFAISSGTTSGEKYLPVSPATIRSARGGALDAVVPFLAARPEARLLDGKLLFLGGSTTLREEGGALVGDMTGILTRHAAGFARRRHVPGAAVAAIGAWDEKIARAAEVCLDADVRMIGGVPSWILAFAETLLAHARARGRRAETLTDVWPGLALYVHGGMAFAPYRRRFRELLGRDDVWCLDGYSASEGGMYAVQDRRDEPDMLPVVDRGVFFELVPVAEVGSAAPTRLALHEAAPGAEYAVAVTTDSGAWAYLVGDVVRVTSVRPLRVLFAGRIAHTLNAFGEHVSGGELDRAVLGAGEAMDVRVREYAVAARFPDAAHTTGGHVWYVEFDGAVPDLTVFGRALDRRVAAGNEDYAAHRARDFGLDGPEVRAVPAGAFHAWMRLRGKVGGQHKVPRVLAPALEGDFVATLPSARRPGGATIVPFAEPPRSA